MELQAPIKTRFSFIKLPSAEKFACGRKDVEKIFGESMLGWVGARTEKLKSFGARYSSQPELTGPVIAELTTSHGTDSHPILNLYAVRSEQYADSAAEEFRCEILPQMKAWLLKELNKPDTAKLGNAECLIVEWTRNKHRIHYVRWR